MKLRAFFIKKASDFSPMPFSLNVNNEIFTRFHPLDDVFRICLVAFHLLFADIADEGFKNKTLVFTFLIADDGYRLFKYDIGV